MLGSLKHIGNKDLMALFKTGFLCSRQIPAKAVLNCYDWAIKIRDEGKCVISGFHSALEKDVFNILVRGKQPIILVFAKCLPLKFPKNLTRAYDDGRLLLISPFDDSIKRASLKTAHLRNKLIIELSDEVVIGFIKKEGMLENIMSSTVKKIIRLI